MLKKQMLRMMIPIIALAPVQVSAQTVWAEGNHAVVFSNSPIVGDGLNRVAEVFNSTQGGDPPATLVEPAEIGENGKYVRSDWISSSGIYRLDQGEAKFRITCNETPFRTLVNSMVDPIVFFGIKPAGHPHSFAGNTSVNETADYAALRNSPKSTCQGGPLWSQGYWRPQLQYEVKPGVWVQVKANNDDFYYVEDYDKVGSLIRVLRGAGFIAGVNPADRLNTARLAEIPDGQGWDKSRRYNGWNGYVCAKVARSNGAVTIVYPDGDSDADINPETGLPRQLANSDGTDPWKSGSCEPAASYHLLLIPNIIAPKCWDGFTPQGDGRGAYRYPIRKEDNSTSDACPDYSWRLPTFQAKTEYTNKGAVWRAKLRLSSDMTNPRGSTFHIDWMYGSDDYVFRQAMRYCMGVTINGVAGEPLTCGDGTFSLTERLIGNGATPPATGLSNNPVLTLVDLGDGPSKYLYGPIPSGSKVGATITHSHN